MTRPVPPERQANNGAFHHVPTLRQRVFLRLGFRYHLNDLPDDAQDRLPGWMMTNGVIRFSMRDRLRLLLTGRLHLQIRQATSVQVDAAESAISFRIGYPGDAA